MALDPRFYDPFDEYRGGNRPRNLDVPLGPGGAAPAAPLPGGVSAPLGDPLGGGGGAGAGGGLNYAGLSVRPTYHFEDAPAFNPTVFQAPTFAQAQQEPGYQFRLAGGRDALEGSASARGTLRTGGTLRDITEYGQNFAAQEYGNVYNRALQSHDRLYRGQYDAWRGNMEEWATLTQAEKEAAMAQFGRELTVWRRPGSGGGGGNDFDRDSAAAPPDPGRPPFLWKVGPNGQYLGNDPEVLAYLDWQRRQQQSANPSAQGEIWPDAF